MNTGIAWGEVKQSPSPIDRGILRDLGWDISISSSTVNWTPAGVNNRASTINNWSQNPYPGDALQFRNNAAGVFDVRMDLQLYQLDKITFGVTAPAYTLHSARLRIQTLPASASRMMASKLILLCLKATRMSSPRCHRQRSEDGL